MEAQTYNTIRQQLDFSPRFFAAISHTVVDAMLIVTSVALLLKATTAAYLGAQVILAAVFFRSFSLMHEAVHGTLSKRPLWNSLLGFWGGVFCFMPYYSWRLLHLEHHKWAGNVEKDPSARLRKDFDPEQKWKYRMLSTIWRSWIPLLGLMQEIVFWTYPSEQLRDPSYSARKKSLVVLSVLAPMAIYAGLWLAFEPLRHPAHWAPAFVLYLALVEMINFPHHMDVHAFRSEKRLPIQHQYLVTRSSHYPRWFSRSLLLNFNYHVEHHLFPTLPWQELDKARPLVKSALGNFYNESQGNAWILKNRTEALTKLLPVTEHSPYPGKKSEEPSKAA